MGIDKKRSLYEYIIAHSHEMTDEWLSLRKKESDFAVYSATAPEYIVKELYTQNSRFIKVLSSEIINDNKDEDIEEWIKEVSESRSKMGTPLDQVIEQFRIFRVVFWNKIKEFTKQSTVEITTEDVLEWSSIIHGVFDDIIESFCKHYYIITEKRIRAQQMTIDKLNSPIIPITNKLGILPLIGEVDTNRAKAIMENTLEKCKELKLEFLVIDLSGVHVIDTMVAQQMFKISSALRLIGVTASLSGMRPEVAEAVIRLGIDFHEIKIYGKLNDALASIYLHGNRLQSLVEGTEM